MFVCLFSMKLFIMSKVFVDGGVGRYTGTLNSLMTCILTCDEAIEIRPTCHKLRPTKNCHGVVCAHRFKTITSCGNDSLARN